MKLTTEERNVMCDFVWSNNAHKEKKAAIQAVCIKYSSKIDGDKDIKPLCEMFRVPVSWASDIRHALLTAKKFRELSVKKTAE